MAETQVLAPPTEPGNAANRYGQMKSEREPYLRRARRLSRLTIPSLFREEGDGGETDMVTPWQSFGAYAVNSLASKMHKSLFPSGLPFIKLKMSRRTQLSLLEVSPDQAGVLRAEITKGLAVIEKEFAEIIEIDGDGKTLFSLLRHTLVGGNHALQHYEDGTLRGIRLDRYTVLRDDHGRLLEGVIEDKLDFETLDDDVQRIALANGYQRPKPAETGGPQRSADTHVTVYTHIILDGDEYRVYQEVQGRKVPETETTYAPDALPYTFHTFLLLEGESYGRSYVEDYEGDLQYLDGMNQIVQEGTAAAALFIRFVRPGGVTSKQQVAQALNGEVLTGNAEDVTTLQSNKQADFAVAEQRIQGVEGRLARAFLMDFAVQREGERVTAEEIRYLAQALNEQLGGAYVNQTTDLQRPYAIRKLRSTMRSDRILRVPEDAVNLQIITGASALSRFSELEALDFFLGGAVPLPSIQAFAGQAINPRTYFARRAAALFIDDDGLLLSDEEIAEAQAQAQQQQMLQAATPELVRQGGNMIQASMEQPAPEEQV